ncbi:MAG: LacI family transcriptional regulator [Lentisphaerae bacterium]|nr:MAG: LacI family transcriptional regulator [Lentisphaerota bacterium]
MNMKTHVTLKDVATEVGLTTMSVSQILRGRGRFALETRKRVFAAAARLGYRPNSQARAVRSGKTNMIAFLFGARSEGSHLDKRTLMGVEHGLRDSGWNLLLTMCDPQELRSGAYIPRFLTEILADGVLINYHFDPPEGVETLIRDHRLPSVWLNRKTGWDAVYFDDFAAGRMAAERLLRRGLRSVSYVEHVPPTEQTTVHYSVADRRAGYSAAMQAAGLAPEVIRLEREEDVHVWGERLAPYEGLVLGRVSLEKVLVALAWQHRLPGRDVMLVTIGHEPMTRFPGVETVMLDWSILGRQAVQLLMRKLKEGEARVAAEVVAPVTIPSNETEMNQR